MANFSIQEKYLKYKTKLPKTSVVFITGVKTAINVLHTAPAQVINSQIFLGKNINFVSALVKVHPLYRHLLSVLDFFYYLLLILEVNVVNPRPQNPYLADFDHVQQICYHRLVAEIYRLNTCKILEVP